MQCVSCLSSNAEEVGGDAPWRNRVCPACGIEAAQDFWVYCAVLETDGRVRSGPGCKYSYVREHWSVTFDRTVLEHVFSSKDDRALYAELYRWHRDPAYAYPPAMREWVRGAIDRTRWFVFEDFVACDDGPGVRYGYDGSVRVSLIGLRAQLAMIERDERAFANLVLEADDPIPGNNGLNWVWDTVRGYYRGVAKSGSLKFSLGSPEFFEVPRSVVNERNVIALREAARKVRSVVSVDR